MLVLKVLGGAIVGLLALLGLVTVIDIATAGSDTRLIGGSPVFPEGENAATMLGGRIVRFPPLLQRDTRRAAVLDEDYYYCAWRTGDVIRIPRGFVTDFASIPSFGRILIDRFGGSLEPATIHDWLYSVGAGTTPEERQIRRAEADAIFLDALADNGVGLGTRWIMYQAVRLFGSGPYDTSADWAGRILNPETGEPFADPIPRPMIAIVDRIDCSHFQDEINRLVGCYSTDREQRFADGLGCGPGDGVTVLRSF